MAVNDWRDFDAKRQTQEAEKRAQQDYSIFEGEEHGMRYGWMMCVHKTRIDSRTGKLHTWYRRWWNPNMTGEIDDFSATNVPDAAFLPGRRPSNAQAPHQADPTFLAVCRRRNVEAPYQPDPNGSCRAKKREHEPKASGKEAADETGEGSSRAKKPKNDDNTCCVCLDGNKTHAFVPCGHKCVCATCAAKIMEQDATCPMCRAECSMFMRVFE